jgi:hypothetical protein
VTYCRELSKEPGTVRLRPTTRRPKLRTRDATSLLSEVDQLCAIFTSSMKKLHPVEPHRA